MHALVYRFQLSPSPSACACVYTVECRLVRLHGVSVQ